MQEGVVATAALFGNEVTGSPIPVGISEKWFRRGKFCAK